MSEFNSDDHYHRKCHHRKYRLTCGQIDELRKAAGGCCQICGKKERYCAGFLRIDHDKTLGYWAVRGLLCGQCNQGLERGWLVGPEVATYLGSAWFRSLPGADQVKPEPEPDWTDFPVVSKDAALVDVRSAAEAYSDAYHAGHRNAAREGRLKLIAACRVTRRVGWTCREIARGMDGFWTSDYVQVVCAERIKQPRRPRAA